MLHLLTLVLVFTVISCNAVAVKYFPSLGGGYGGEFVEGKLRGGEFGYGAGGGAGGIGVGYGHHGGVGIGAGIGHEGIGIGYGGAGVKGGAGGIGIGYGGPGIKEAGLGAGGIGIGYGGGIKEAGIGGGIGYGHGLGSGVGGVGIGYGGEGIGYGKGIGVGAGGIGIGYGGTGKAIGLGYGVGGIGGHGHGFGGGAGGLGIGVGKYIGGEEIDKNIYSGGKKNQGGEHFVKSHGNEGGEVSHGDVGFAKGEVAAKDIKGESAHFSDVDGGKKVIHDGKEYHGAEHFDKEGKHGGEKTIKQGHKKGHVIKGFKSSHHKDESGKTEEFYDEDHDEGGNYGFDGHIGKFGEGGASSFKGGFEDGKFNAEEAKKAGHYDKEYIVDKAHANHGKFGENKYAGNEEVYGANKGVDEHDLTGHHESSKFFKHYPIHY